MDLVPVAPGLLGPAAIAARGADPMYLLSAGHTLHSSAGNAIKASPAPGVAGAHVASESAIANVLDDNFFYIGQIVGTTLVNGSTLARYLALKERHCGFNSSARRRP